VAVALEVIVLVEALEVDVGRQRSGEATKKTTTTTTTTTESNQQMLASAAMTTTTTTTTTTTMTTTTQWWLHHATTTNLLLKVELHGLPACVVGIPSNDNRRQIAEQEPRTPAA